jgi:hypothetical protein
MCPTFLHSVRSGFGTSEDLLSGYDRSDRRGLALDADNDDKRNSNRRSLP